MYLSRLILINVLAISLLWAGQLHEPVLRTRIALTESLREPPGLMKVRSHSVGGMTFHILAESWRREFDNLIWPTFVDLAHL